MSAHRKPKIRGQVEVTREPDDISPKVATATGGSAVAVVLAWVLSQIPVVDHAPPAVQAALALVLISAATFAAGYLKRDTAPDPVDLE